MSDILRRIQETELDILKELDRICKKHDIEYFLSQGTLLGAAKYKGFIPWDDDIDVMLRYDELERLIKIFPNETKRDYIITNYKKESHFALSWTKIRDKNTLSRPERYKDIPVNWGICIDLFPIYPISGFKPLRAAEKFMYKAANKIIMAEWTKYEENHTLFTRLLEKLPVGFRNLCLNCAEGVLKLHGGGSEYVLIPCRGVKLVKRSLIFGERKSLEFEGENYPAPADYHKYLTANYGDYTQPPPKEEARNHDDRMGKIEWRLQEKGE